MPRVMEVLLCRWIRPHHYIVLMGSMSIVAFVTAYVISVTYDHVNALFPYISSTGTKPPESCVFGFFLNISSVLAFVCMFIRHENFADQIFIESQSSHFLNDLGLLFGFLSALGMCIVANFQETNVLSVHLVGACMVFGFGVVYCLVHSYLSYRSIAFGMNSLCTFWVRFLLSFCTTCFLILTFLGASIANMQWRKGSHHTKDTKLEWKASDPGYNWHLASTFSEWLMAISFIFYFFTFYPEFGRIRITTKVHQPYNPDSPRSPETLTGEGIMA